MSLSEMQVFNEYFQPVVIETLAQDIEKFNAASAGTIQLTTGSFDGDFLQESFWNSIHSAQARVDMNAAQATVASTDLSQGVENRVKVAGRFGPIRFEPSQMTWLQKPTAEAIEVVSRQMSQALLNDQLNTAINAVTAAITNQADATSDVSATAGVSHIGMNNAYAKFGDASSQIRANIMTGAAYHKFIGENLANANNLFQSGNVMVVDILGRAFVVTDAAGLYQAGTPNKSIVLGLSSGAVVVSDGGNLNTNIVTANGKTRLETTIQSEYDFNVRLKGYSWDESNGGKSPSDAALATGTNWDKTVTNIKTTAGVALVADADK